MTLLIGSIVVALTVSFLCSLMEATLLSLTPGQMADLQRKHPKEGAVWQGLKQNIQRPITVILTLNTAANTLGATVAGSQFAVVFGHSWIALFSISLTYVMLQFTEILPKSLGVRFNMAIAPYMARPLAGLLVIMSPIIRFITFVNRVFVGTPKEGHGATALQEIEALAGTARLANVIGKHQERIIQTTTRLSRLTAKDVMVPFDQITFLSATQRLTDAIITAHMDPHTRFPIIEGDDKNKILGYINFKELVYRARTNPADPTLRGIIRPIGFVAPATTCNLVLRSFVDEHMHIAIVYDDVAKQTLGLLTLEDLVEELVGEIEDEFDHLPKMCQALSGGVWIVGGGVPAADMFARVGMPPETTKDVVSPWIIARLGKLPKIGQVINVGEKDITVRRIRRGKIFEVLVTPHGLAPKEFM